MDHTRHSGIYNIPSGFSVTMIGAGGIGATCALALAKMGVQTMVAYDDDTVSDVNIPTQLHPVSDIGHLKTVSLERTLHRFSDELTFIGHPMRVDDLSVLRSSLVISAVDNISARQSVWMALNNDDSHWVWYVDTRMAAEELQLFVMRRVDENAVERYGAHLMGMDESSAPDLACTMKATFHCSLMVAAHIGKIVRDIVRGEARSHRLVHVIPDNWLETFEL